MPIVGALLAALDRAWWARVIRRGDLVDLDLVIAQGGPPSARRAIRAYVRGGHRTGMSLNPLFMEQLVSRQLSDADRVPALYAYLVNDQAAIHTSVNWDAPAYAERWPGSLEDPGGPLGHAWRAALAGGEIALGPGGSKKLPVAAVREAAIDAVRARSRHRSAPPPVRAGDVLICRLARDERDPASALGEAADFALSTGASLVVSVAGGSADTWINACVLAHWVPDAHVVADDPRTIAALLRTADPSSVAVVRGPNAQISARDLRRLAEEGLHRPTAALQLAPDGTVASAGTYAHAGRLRHLLAGHPVEDALALGERVPSATLAGDTWAQSTATASQPPQVLLSAVARAPRGTSLLLRETGRPDTDLATLLSPLHLKVREWSATGPVLLRAQQQVALADGTRVPCLRWAVKIAAPPGAPGEAWGDTHFARGIAEALRRLGQEVVIDAYDARRRPSAYLDDVVLALRGPEPMRPQAGAKSLLWIISHPDEIRREDLDGFDVVYAGSAPWAATASRRFGRPVHALLQCTDARRFVPHGLPRTDELLFVGTARGIPRPSVLEPIRAGIPVSVYGPDWTGWIPGAAIAGRGIPNEDLPAAYERAAAVLNDHWPAMQREGFVSNRLYDVVAAGGRAVSDAVEGIHDIFEGAVWTYDDIPELIDALRHGVDRLFPSEERLAEISSRVREQHSFDARARTLLDAALSG
jgi:hypothetical protein